VWPVTLRSVGGTDARGSPATWRLLAPSWIGGKPTTFGEAASSMELIPGVNPRRLPRQGRGMSQAAPGARSRRKRGVRARSAIRHTVPGEGASASSILDSGPEDSARGRRAQRATRRSNGAPHHAPPTALTHRRRCSPARQACRAGLTPPAAGSDRKLASPRHLPSSPPCIGVVPPHPVRSRDLDLHSGATTPVIGLRCADRSGTAGSTAPADRWRRSSGGAPVPGGGPLGAVESVEVGTDLDEDVDEADRADAG
jgi:hypothetical protein